MGHAISCKYGTTYGDGCSSSASTTVEYDCGSGYDQCYKWEYTSSTCDYATQGCDNSASSWCASAYQNNAAYEATCCDSDNCNTYSGESSVVVVTATIAQNCAADFVFENKFGWWWQCVPLA